MHEQCSTLYWHCLWSFKRLYNITCCDWYSASDIQSRGTKTDRSYCKAFFLFYCDKHSLTSYISCIMRKQSYLLIWLGPPHALFMSFMNLKHCVFSANQCRQNLKCSCLAAEISSKSHALHRPWGLSQDTLLPRPFCPGVQRLGQLNMMSK